MTTTTRTLRGLAAAALAGAIAGSVATAALLQTPDLMADAETVRAVTAVKHAIVAGHKARDRAALDRLYTNDYTAIDARGTRRTKHQLLADLPNGADIVEGRYDILAVRRWGDVAVATGHGHLVYRNPDGTTRVSDYYSFNVFTQQDGRWRYAAAFLP